MNMTDKDWLARVSVGAKVYNEQRLHRDFQAEEVNKFVSWLYDQYGIIETKQKNDKSKQ